MVPPDDHRQPVVGHRTPFNPDRERAAFAGHASDNLTAVAGTCMPLQSGRRNAAHRKAGQNPIRLHGHAPQLLVIALYAADAKHRQLPRFAVPGRYAPRVISLWERDIDGERYRLPRSRRVPAAAAAGRGIARIWSAAVLSRYASIRGSVTVFHKVHENTLRHASHLELVRGRVRHSPASRAGRRPTNPTPLSIRDFSWPGPSHDVGNSTWRQDDTSPLPKGANARRGLYTPRPNGTASGALRRVKIGRHIE